MEVIKREMRRETVAFLAATTSAEVSGAGFAGGTFTTPSSITGTSFGIEVCNPHPTTGADTWTSLYKTADDATGTESIVAIAVTASRTYALPDQLFGVSRWRFKSNGTETITVTLNRAT